MSDTVQRSPSDSRELYNKTAGGWTRQGPISLSDFTARPVVLAMCEPVEGKVVLDLGCGEGYCTRLLRQRGAASVHGIDLSEEMISSARSQERAAPLGVSYGVGCATEIGQVPGAAHDLVTAVFLFNYLNVEQTRRCMSEIVRVLRPGGHFVFSIPHPSFPFMRPPGEPFYFDVGNERYFGARDHKFHGRIWRRDGRALNVQLVHKTLEDYMDALANAGFTKMPVVREMRVTQEHLDLDPTFFGPLADIPLHIAMRVQL